jgi:hypothetical protein
MKPKNREDRSLTAYQGRDDWILGDFALVKRSVFACTVAKDKGGMQVQAACPF